MMIINVLAFSGPFLSSITIPIYKSESYKIKTRIHILERPGEVSGSQGMAIFLSSSLPVFLRYFGRSFDVN